MASTTSGATHEKYQRLQETLSSMGSVLVAYSGGVDSTLLLKAAHDTLGTKALGVLASSPMYPASENEHAKRVAEELGLSIVEIHTDELEDAEFARNTPARCYHCKLELFGKLKIIAEQRGLEWVAHGANVDDLGDYRPGQQASEELGIRAPLQEVGLTKAEIREISKSLGLPTWDKPSYACLASRFPYGTRITPEAVKRVEEAERVLASLGFGQFRVRDHGTIARIEVEGKELGKLLQPEPREQIIKRLKELGYLYVTADIEGYRTGSMNAPLNGGKWTRSKS